MTRVDFNLRDFSGVSWDSGTVPVITFRPSGSAVSPFGASAGVVEVSPALDGSVSVELQATTSMFSRVTYSMELAWIEGGQSKRAFWDYRLSVPERESVPLMDLLSMKPDDRYEVIEFSAGTIIDGQPYPHSSKTTMWFRDEGGQYRHMIRSVA